MARSLENEFLCEQALALNTIVINIFLFFFVKIQALGQSLSHTTVVMMTQISKPSGQVRSPTTPTGEESVTPVSQPSGLGELSTSMLTEPDRKQEEIQRAQVGSLMGADGNKERQDKTSKKQSPTSATRPKKYALEMWVEIETSAGMHSAPEEDSYSVDFAIDTINHAYPGCTGMYLGVAGHMLAFYGKKTNPRAGLLLG